MVMRIGKRRRKENYSKMPLVEESQAETLTELIQKVAPAYSVKWNGKNFEIWANGTVHYRRDTFKDVTELMGKKYYEFAEDVTVRDSQRQVK